MKQAHKKGLRNVEVTKKLLMLRGKVYYYIVIVNYK